VHLADLQRPNDDDFDALPAVERGTLEAIHTLTLDDVLELLDLMDVPEEAVLRRLGYSPNDQGRLSRIEEALLRCSPASRSA